MVLYSSDETASSGLGDVPNWAFCPVARLLDFGISLQINLNLLIQWQLCGCLCDATGLHVAQKVAQAESPGKISPLDG